VWVVTDTSGNLAVSIFRVEASTASLRIVHIKRKEGISQEERVGRNVGEETMLSRPMGTKQIRPGYRMELLRLLLWKVESSGRACTRFLQNVENYTQIHGITI
jgi:hypothetical protein